VYFHGHVHLNQFYTWPGPDNTISLPVVSVDSPMKGIISSENEKKLSFQLLSVDTGRRLITIREVFWNSNPSDPSLTFGGSETLGLTGRSR